MRVKSSIGFTGTRHGMSAQQQATFKQIITDLNPSRFGHGACLGSDGQAVQIVRLRDHCCYIVAYPGKSARGGDNEWLDTESIAASDEVREANLHFARNRDIVNEQDILIATPREAMRQQRGGTEYTIGYAIKAGKPVYVIMPNGTIERFNSQEITKQ